METAILVVTKIVDYGFGGKLPGEHVDVAFAVACLAMFCPSADLLVQERFAYNICEALWLLRITRSQQVN